MPPIDSSRSITTRNQPSTAGFKFSLTIEWWTRPMWTRLLDLAEMALMERRPAAATSRAPACQRRAEPPADIDVS